MRVLLVVATQAEAENLERLGHTLSVCGVGAVNAALATAGALRGGAFDLAVSAGIGGAYPASGLTPGDLAVSSELVYGGLGALDGAHFLDLEALGLPLLPGVYNRLAAWDGARDWADSVGAACGPTLTLDTVTGSLERAREIEARFPGALIEGMEGAGVAHAARLVGVPALEVRGVSNPVGPRNRAAWRVREALAALRGALARLP